MKRWMIFIFSSLLTLLSKYESFTQSSIPRRLFHYQRRQKESGNQRTHFCLETVLNTAFLDHCEEILTTHARLSARAKVPGLVFYEQVRHGRRKFGGQSGYKVTLSGRRGHRLKFLGSLSVSSSSEAVHHVWPWKGRQRSRKGRCQAP